MLKSQAIDLLGGSTASAAVAIGISYQAVDKWPEVLPGRIEDRVLAACVRGNISIPAELITQDGVPAAPARTPTEPTKEVEHG